MPSNIQQYYSSFYTFYESHFSRVRHPSHPGRGHGSLTCHMTQFERSDWLRSENFMNLMIELRFILQIAVRVWLIICKEQTAGSYTFRFLTWPYALVENTSLNICWSIIYILYPIGLHLLQAIQIWPGFLWYRFRIPLTVFTLRNVPRAIGPHGLSCQKTDTEDEICDLYCRSQMYCFTEAL